MNNPSEIIAVIVSASATLTAAYFLKSYVDDKNKQDEESRRLYGHLVRLIGKSKICLGYNQSKRSEKLGPLYDALEAFVEDEPSMFFISDDLRNKVSLLKEDVLLKIIYLINEPDEKNIDDSFNENMGKFEDKADKIRVALKNERKLFHLKLLGFIPCYLLTVAIVSHFLFSHYVGIFYFFINLICGCV